MTHGVKINDALDSNVGFYWYLQGVNEFVDQIVMFIPDPNQTKWNATYRRDVPAEYLHKDIKVYSKEGDIAASDILVWRGRVAAIPDWRRGFIVIVGEGYIKQYSDRMWGVLNMVQDIAEDYVAARFTGYIRSFPTSVRIQDDGAGSRSGKSWSNDDWNNFIVIIDTLSTIPSAERFIALDWQVDPVADIEIQASADDALLNSSSGWDNNGTVQNIGTVVVPAQTIDGYFRFPLNVPVGSTINACNLRIYCQGKTGSPTFEIILIDSDDCPAFPDVGSSTANHPESAYKVTGQAPPAGAAWWSIDITALVQNFIDSDITGTYRPGQYIGFKVKPETTGDQRVLVRFFDAVTDEPNLNALSFTAAPPDKIQYVIADTVAPDVIEMTSFDLDGLMIGQAYMITWQTTLVAREFIQNRDWQVAVTASLTESEVGIIRKFLDGTYDFDIIRACRNVDGYIYRLLMAMTYIMKPPANIASSGTLPEDIIENFYDSNSPPGYMYNVVKGKDRYGQTISRSWNYTTHAPQEGAVPTALPSGWQRRELYIASPQYADATTMKEIADRELKLRADPFDGENTTLEIKGDPYISGTPNIAIEPGLKITFVYQGITYTDYIVTRKRFDSRSNRTTLKLLKYR